MPSKSYQYILLDWDGNLAKTLDVWLKACHQPLLKRGIELDDKTISTCFGIPEEKFTEWGVRDVASALQEIDAIAAKLLPDAELQPNAAFVLEELKKAGKQTALVTSSKRSNVIDQLGKHDLLRHFDAIVTGDDVKLAKPNPEPLAKALSELGGKKESAIMVGDTEKDINAANRFGIDSILFYPKSHEGFYNLAMLEQARPTYIVTNFKEVLDIAN